MSVEGHVIDYNIGEGEWVEGWFLLDECPENITVLVNGVVVSALGNIIEKAEVEGRCNLTLNGAPLSLFRVASGLNVTLIAVNNNTITKIFIIYSNNYDGVGGAMATSSQEARPDTGELNPSSKGIVDKGLSEPDKRAVITDSPARLLAALALGAASLMSAVREYGRRVEGG